jgi:bHLH factor
MADTAGYPTHDAKAADSLHTNKRKRESRDHASRPAPGEPARSNNASTGAADLSDQNTAAFLAAHNAATDDNMQNSSLDFGLQQNGGASSSNAGDTAAAALAHYSMTVPQATELSFQASGSGGEGSSFALGDHTVHQQQQHGMPDIVMDVLKTPSNAQLAGNSAPNDSPPNASGQKPQVGSDEWHKVRRDNHKEGEFPRLHYKVYAGMRRC